MQTAVYVRSAESEKMSAGLSLEGIPASRYSVVSRDPARPRGKRHSLPHAVDHMSLDMVDHVLGIMPKSSIPTQLHNFEGQRSSRSYDHKKVEVPT